MPLIIYDFIDIKMNVDNEIGRADQCDAMSMGVKWGEWTPREQTRVFANLTRELTQEELNSLQPSSDGTPSGNKKPHVDAGNVKVKLPPIQSQIIAGNKAQLGQFPWQALVIQDRQYLCGGSLISVDYVLTAAHCAYLVNTFEIYLGAFNRAAKRERNRIRLVSTTKTVHEKYNEYYLTNDVALVKLPSDVRITSFINTIRLPRQSQSTMTFTNSQVTISGWGKSSPEPSKLPSKTLKYVSLTVISNSDCAQYYGVEYVTNSTLCTRGADTKNICNGDSGGPLIILEDDNKWTQVGVVSYGSAISCAWGLPAGFSRVTSFLAWISKISDLQILQ